MALTVSDLFESIMAEGGNAIFPGIGGMAAPFISKWTQKATGNDLYWDINLGYERPSQRMGSQIARQMNSLGRSVTDDLMKQNMERAARLYQMRAHPQAEWTASPESARWNGNYNAYITSQANAMTRTMFAGEIYSMVNKITGFEDSVTGDAALGQFASMVAEAGVRRGQAGAMQFGRRAAMELFRQRDANGNEIGFRRDDWGGFSKEAVAELAGGLAKDIDFLAKSGDPSNLDHAIKNLSSTVKKYTDALEPLGAVFGDDIGKMRDVIERVTNQSMSLTSPDRLRQVSRRLAAGIDTGLYTLGGPTGIDTISGAMQMYLDPSKRGGMSAYNYTRGTSATLAADFFSGGRPVNVTETEWRRSSMKTAAAADNNGMEDLMSRIYASYTGISGNENVTPEEFMNRVRARAAQDDTTLLQAMRDMTGNKSTLDYRTDSIVNHRARVAFKESGQGGLANIDQAVNTYASRARSRAIGELRGAFRSQGITMRRSEAWDMWFNLASTTNLLQMDEASQAEFIASRTDLTDEQKRAIQLVNNNTNDSAVGSTQHQLTILMTQRRNAQESARIRKDYQNRQDLFKTMSGNATSIIDELARGKDLMQILKEKGAEAVTRKLSAQDSTTLQNLGKFSSAHADAFSAAVGVLQGPNAGRFQELLETDMDRAYLYAQFGEKSELLYGNGGAPMLYTGDTEHGDLVPLTDPTNIAERLKESGDKKKTLWNSMMLGRINDLYTANGDRDQFNRLMELWRRMDGKDLGKLEEVAKGTGATDTDLALYRTMHVSTDNDLGTQAVGGSSITDALKALPEALKKLTELLENWPKKEG